jgi:hypothetical protein
MNSFKKLNYNASENWYGLYLDQPAVSIQTLYP